MEDILSSFSQRRLIVVGDLIVDEYHTGEALGLSAETPTRGEYVATLSIIGSAVCVAGASLMRCAQISPRHDVKTSQSSPLVCQKCES